MVSSFLLDGIKRAVPALFVSLKPVLKDSAKCQSIQEFVESIFSSTMATQDDPTVFVWAAYFLAQHALYLADIQKALHYLMQLEQHSPTLPEIYTLKAKVLKSAGDWAGASTQMKVARELDKQDRFLNWKTAKYLIRIGKFEEAEVIMGLFTKVWPFM